MKLNRLLPIIVIVAIVLSIAPLRSSYAQAYSTTFTTSITYQNVGNDTANIVVSFYASPDTTTPITVNLPQLAKGASSSLHIGTVTSVPSGFRGSVVMSSDQPLVATMVQLPQGTSPGTRNRPLSNGFAEGGRTVLIATVLKNYYQTNTVFSVQNIGNTASTLTFRFYDTSAQEVHSFSQTVQPGASYYVDAGTLSGLGPAFNGSAVIESTSADIVGGALELSTVGSGAAAFEGVSVGATKVYMPSALCNAYGANTSYAVQNTSLTASAVVTVTYSNGIRDVKTIGPGAKQSFVACNAPGMSAGFSGSAVIESSVPIVAIGKAYGSGLSTAFVGATAGASRVALPYVRWANNTNWANGTQQRVFLTIQNIGNTELPAGAVTVRYIDKNGNQVGSVHSLPNIPAGGKVNSNASNAGLSEFGVYPDGTFGGGAIVEGPEGSQLAVVARVSTQIAPGVFASEDYSGFLLP